ncbi:MAG: hypothetical protein AMJ67_15375 [Betaproteobacteria bacterium SG8_41]|jgi:hypothetical protein|nr:MAG: hypothetical protein AMJ67_15375 [Betaproteobacteria bacterium SG8_41]
MPATFRSRAAIVAFVSLFVLAALSVDVLAQTRPQRTEFEGKPPQSILWVGNSFFYYNNSMHNYVGRIVRATKGKHRSSSVTISGSGLDWHDVESYFRPNGIGKYSFVAGNEIRFNKFEKLFDAVILMDCSQCPIHPKLKAVFHDYAKKHSDTARRHGAAPMLFMSWAYKDKPEMTAQLAEEYTKAGNDNDALVIPAGLAFAKAIEKQSDLELYQPDKRHPSKLGTYLAAATVYAAVYRKSPVGNTYTGGIDPETARFLQEVAWQTVGQYFQH